MLESRNPGRKNPTGLGCSRFARRYLGNLCLISFPEGTEMVQFPSFASLPYFTWIEITGRYSRRVAPFGHMRVKACLAAHRTLSWPDTVLHRHARPKVYKHH